LILRAEQKNFTISAGDVFFSG